MALRWCGGGEDGGDSCHDGDDWSYDCSGGLTYDSHGDQSCLLGWTYDYQSCPLGWTYDYQSCHLGWTYDCQDWTYDLLYDCSGGDLSYDPYDLLLPWSLSHPEY